MALILNNSVTNAGFGVDYYLRLVNITDNITTIYGPYTITSGSFTPSPYIPIPFVKGKSYRVEGFTTCDPATVVSTTTLTFGQKTYVTDITSTTTCTSTGMVNNLQIYVDYSDPSNSNLQYYKPSFPARVVVTDNTNAIVKDTTGINYLPLTITIPNGDCNKTYTVKLITSCETMERTDIPAGCAPVNPLSPNVFFDKDCLPNMAVVRIGGYLIPGETYTRVLTSGPAIQGVTYPVTFGDNGLKHVPAGTYTYTLTSSCRGSVNGSFTVTPAQFSNTAFTYAINKNCAASATTATVTWNAADHHPYASSISSLTTSVNPSSSTNGTTDTYGNFISGHTYRLVVTLDVFDRQIINNAQPLADPNNVCNDTLLNYVFTVNNGQPILSAYSIACSATAPTTNVYATAVGTGTVYYQLESSTGTVITPFQTSGEFLNKPFPGDYRVRAKDDCGTEVVYNVTSQMFSPDVNVTGRPCSGGDVTMSATQFPGTTYAWTGPNNFSASTASVTIPNFSSANNGTYEVTVNYGSCSPVTKSVKFVNCVLPSVIHSFTGKVSGCSGTLTLKGNFEPFTTLTAQESLDGKTFKEVTNTVTGPMPAGTYNLPVPVYNSGAFYRISMRDRDGGTAESRIIMLTGNCIIEGYLFPVPAHDFVQIANFPANAKVKITDADGRDVSSKTTISSTGRVSVNSLSDGVYFVKIMKGNSVIRTGKFIVAK